MIQQILVKKFGNPLEDTETFEEKFMITWLVPTDIKEAIPVLPEHIYCNELLTKPLQDAFRSVIKLCLTTEINGWDGCFNPRCVRGQPDRISMHAWGLAIDLNANENPLYSNTTTFSPAFIAAFEDCGWIWGGNFKRHDPMHFEFHPQITQ